MDAIRVRLEDPARTEVLGELLGRELAPGQGLALVGELGSGKTCLTRGLGRGLGLDDPAAVCSPTYLLVVEHPGRCPLLHMDAYLEAKSRAFLLDGGLDYLSEFQGVVAIEWADKVADLVPAESLWVELRLCPGVAQPAREAIMDPGGSRAFSWLEKIPAALNRGAGPPVAPGGTPQERFPES